MSTRPDHDAGHGDHLRWLAVLGVAAAAAALSLPSVAPRIADRLGDDTSAAEPVDVHAQLPPFMVEPAVRLTPADRQPPRASPATGPPDRLVVPELGVDAPVIAIRAPGRVLLPPSDPRILGWWQDGAVPGAAVGGALITGHTVHTGGGAFDDLDTLRRGDRVLVRTGKGSIRYAVTGVTIYRKATLAKDAAQVFRQSGPGRLVLVTCEDWNGSTYLSNAVVFAEPLGRSR